MCSTYSVYVCVCVHALLSEFLTNGHLPQVSCQSCLSAKDKSNNEMKQGAMHRSPGIYLTVEKNFN